MPKFSMANAKPKGTFNRDKAEPGTYLVEIRDLRESSGHNGDGFFADVTVKEVIAQAKRKGETVKPSDPGFEFAVPVFPDMARGGKGISPQMAKEIEEGKIQLIVGAAYGYDKSNVGLVDDKAYAYAIQRPKSPLAGRLMIVKAHPHINTKGEDSVFYEAFPYVVDGKSPYSGSEAPKTEERPAGPPALPPKTAPAFKAPTFEELLAKHGYAVHPEDPSYVYNAEGYMKVDEFKAKFTS